MKRFLLLTPLAACLTLHCASADLVTLAQLDPSVQPSGSPLVAAPYSGGALALPSLVSAGDGNRIGIIPAEAAGRMGVLLLEKAAGTDRASFGFSWPAGTLPPAGVFALRTQFRGGLPSEESGNFTISIHTGGERLMTLQIGRTGVLHLILPDAATQYEAGRLRAEWGEFYELTLELDYTRHELRLAIDGDSAVLTLPFESGQSPTSVLFATSTIRESARRMEFREIPITHELTER